jgi:hypothetical protein
MDRIPRNLSLPIVIWNHARKSKLVITVDRARHKDIEFVCNLQHAQEIFILHSTEISARVYWCDVFIITYRLFPSSFHFFHDIR